MKKFLALISLFPLVSCFAVDPHSSTRDHLTDIVEFGAVEDQEEHLEWDYVYQGSDSFTGEECYLYIRVGEDGLIEGMTNYKNELLNLTYQRNGLSSDRAAAGKGVLIISLSSPNMLDPISYLYRRFHLDHYDNESCENLALTDHYPEVIGEEGDEDHDDDEH